MSGREDGSDPATMICRRQDDSDSGAHRAGTTDQLTFACDKGAVTDADPTDVRDRVGTTWLSGSDDDVEISRTHSSDLATNGPVLETGASRDHAAAPMSAR
jgi:hypothetical protein